MYGCGGDSGSTESKADNTRPTSSDVTSVSMVSGSGSKLSVSWTAASDPGGSSAANLLYHVYVAENAFNRWTEVDSFIGVTSATIGKLHSHTLYVVRIVVEDEAGNLSAPGSSSSDTTDNMSFAGDVFEIIQANCTAVGCHTNKNSAGTTVIPASDIALNGDAATTLQALMNRQVSCAGLKPLINTSNGAIIADSYLDDLLDPARRNNNPCSSPMPQDKALANADFAVVYDWLADGALQ